MRALVFICVAMLASACGPKDDKHTVALFVVGDQATGYRGHIDDGHGHPGTRLTIDDCLVDGHEWKPSKDGLCHLRTSLGDFAMGPGHLGYEK